MQKRRDDDHPNTIQSNCGGSDKSLTATSFPEPSKDGVILQMMQMKRKTKCSDLYGLGDLKLKLP